MPSGHIIWQQKKKTVTILSLLEIVHLDLFALAWTHTVFALLHVIFSFAIDRKKNETQQFALEIEPCENIDWFTLLCILCIVNFRRTVCKQFSAAMVNFTKYRLKLSFIENLTELLLIGNYIDWKWLGSNWIQCVRVCVSACVFQCMILFTLFKMDKCNAMNCCEIES